jgi:hypothetical protein
MLGGEFAWVTTESFKNADGIVVDRMTDYRSGPRTRGVKVPNLQIVCVRHCKPFGNGRPTDVSGAHEQELHRDKAPFLSQRE